MGSSVDFKVLGMLDMRYLLRRVVYKEQGWLKIGLYDVDSKVEGVGVFIVDIMKICGDFEVSLNVFCVMIWL